MSKEIKTESIGNQVIEYIEIDEIDVESAQKLFKAVLGDVIHELSQPARNLLEGIHGFANAKLNRLKQDSDSQIDIHEITFARRELRENLHWTKTRLKIHLDELLESELVMIVSKGARGLRHYRLVPPFQWS